MIDKLFYIILLIIILFVVPILIAFSKVVSSGGNLDKMWKDVTGNKLNNKAEDKKLDNNIITTNKASQLIRTISGIIFSIMLLSYPVLFGTKRNGEPIINLTVNVRIAIFSILIIITIIVFIIMWYQDRSKS